MSDSSSTPPSSAPPKVTSLVALRSARDRAIQVLTDRFAGDILDVDEFERRVTLVHTASTLVEIEAQVADLAEPDGASPQSQALTVAATAAAGGELVPMAEVREQQGVLTVMGSSSRAGAWSVPRHLRVKTVMGSMVLDFREARLPAGEVDVWVTTVMGSVEIIVPPGLAVEMHGTAILGSFEEVDRATQTPDPDRPLLRVHGLSVMGSVEVRMRIVGESEWDARRRRRRERKEERRGRREPEHHDRHEHLDGHHGNRHKRLGP